MTKKHSKLGASASERWMNCPQSVRDLENLPIYTSSYAEEGTKAHEVAEREVQFRVHGIVYDIKDWMTDEMREHASAYAAYVQSRLGGYEDEIETETRFNLATLHPDFFGTADCVIYKPAEKRLIVIDYKYGQGIAVEARGNPQLRYYALGAAMKKHNRGITTIETVIFQPRASHPDGPIRTDEIDALELLDWSADLVAAAKATEDPNAPYNPGPWCQFCPKAPTCQALRDRALAAAQADFAADGTLHLSDVTSYPAKAAWDLLPQIDLIEDWCRSVRTFAHHEAEAGRIDPRWKLVATRPTRKWKDEEQALHRLLETLDREDVFIEKIKSPAQIEKVIGKKRKAEIADLIESVSSGTVLAPADDPRPPVRAEATTEFSVIEN